MKTLIVVSGGDAPGINTAITGFLKLAQAADDTVLGAQGGFAGVLNNPLEKLAFGTVAPFAALGGTYLASSREPVLAQADAQARLKQTLDAYQIDNLLVFGGNGTLHYVMPLLQQWKIPTIALPTTIDNDVAGTERTLGFDSACNYAYQAVEGVLATARALPGRIFMIETLGGDTGYLALEVALGSGAHVVLVPEYTYDNQWFANRLKWSISIDGYALVVLSEGVPNIHEFPEMIPRLTGVRLRYTRLGHAQRGGRVTHIDRRLAIDMARLAYRGLYGGITQGTLLVQSGQLQLHEGPHDAQDKAPPNREQYDFVNGWM